MEVEIFIPEGASIAPIKREYPDLQHDGGGRYFVGNSSDEEHEGREWLNYTEAVACCGFVEGAVPGAYPLIEGNGDWAQSMISRRDFSGLAVSKSERASYERVSNLFWKHFRRGQLARTQL